MLARRDGPIIASDLSPRVLRRNLARLTSLGLARRVSLLAFDALRTPFPEASVGTLTTNLGLPNLRHGAGVFEEIRRILAGSFLAVTHFYPADDGSASTIVAAGLAELLYRPLLESRVASAGLRLRRHSSRLAPACPTPPSDLFAGGRLDLLPVTDTVLEWCLLEAT
jgi:ubiquinone/menaquinone biosynthesis C-methylase UbiE